MGRRSWSDVRRVLGMLMTAQGGTGVLYQIRMTFKIYKDKISEMSGERNGGLRYHKPCTLINRISTCDALSME